MARTHNLQSRKKAMDFFGKRYVSTERFKIFSKENYQLQRYAFSDITKIRNLGIVNKSAMNISK